ncbi:hypothetical protein ABT160_24505 [Streptomyces sp. NPDC001941]|uniref:hypothetical protein n=1 Tax=Streptomyces sp. NPDC001941 TaxID=3154659 RepID=UPI003324DE26
MDRRLIQTAVFGSSDSDDPAVCPETVDELIAFRLEHQDQTLWCGTKFEGGCGRRLTTRLYHDKICHFAHYGSDGSGEKCARTAKGKDSANHLFAKAHLSSWLRAQGTTAQFSYPEPLGSAVLAELDDGRTLLVHLDRSYPVDWNASTWEVILGPGVPVPANVLNQRGYVQRIRFEDRPGGGRIMRFGTEHPGEGTTWDSLDDVKLTAKGVNTTTRPDAERAPLTDRPAPYGSGPSAPREIVTISPRPESTRTARENDAVMRAVMHLDRALRQQPEHVYSAVAAIKKLLETETLPDNVTRLTIARDQGQILLDQRSRQRSTLLQQLQKTPTVGLLAQINKLMKDDNVSVAEREIVRLAREKYQRAKASHQRLEQERSAARKHEAERARRRQEAAREQRLAEIEADRRERAQQALAAERERAKAEALRAEQEQAERLAFLVPFTLGALKKAAREGRTSTWQELRERTGQRELARLTFQDQLKVLAAVEKKTRPQDPLWSAVLAATGTQDALHLYRALAHSLGRPVPDDDTELLAHVTQDHIRLRHQW